MNAFPWDEVVRVIGTIAVLVVQYLLSRPKRAIGQTPSDKSLPGAKEVVTRAVGAAGTIAVIWT